MDIEIGISKLISLGVIYAIHMYRQYTASTRIYEVVDTSFGKVRGRQRKNFYREHDNYYAFEGIPYAKPPLGELRFRAPKPPEPWLGILDCTNCRSKPVQFSYLFRLAEGSEDCLHLNVYAKKLKTEKPLPVMVYIYGGGFQFGEATRDFYGPDYFMQKDVVVVIFNYRLGVLGILCFDDPDLNIPGNAGLKDQVLALKWIKANIHNFNGDPNNITVFGVSAGGASTHFLMSTPHTKGLFHKAIIQSASILCPWSLTNRHDWGYKFACHISYKGEQNDKSVYSFLAKQKSTNFALRDLSLLCKEDIMRNILYVFGPVVEPYLTKSCIVDKPIKELLAQGWGNEIPLIIGGASFEGLMFYNTKYADTINNQTDMLQLLPDDIQRSRNDKKFTEMASKLKQTYFNGQQPNVNDHSFQYLDLLGHRTFWHGIFRTIRARSKYAKQASTYCYLFDFDSEFFNHFRVLRCGPSVRGVTHADDVSYIFYNGSSVRLNCDSREYKCIQRIIGMWYNFALTSNPNCEIIKPTVWKPVADCMASIKCLTISDDIKFKNLPFDKKLRVWDEFYKKEDLI